MSIEPHQSVSVSRPNAYWLSFCALVLIPSFMSVLYFAFVASNQYVVEARFAVHRAQRDFGHDGMRSSDTAASLGGWPDLGNEDAYIIADYIESRAIIDDLSKTVDVTSIFQRPEADFWARLRSPVSAEELTDYWKKRVRAFVERTSGIVILTVRTFRPVDSQALATAIIAASETLVNNVPLRAHQAIMQDAEDEVRRSEALVRTALQNLRTFRDNQGFIDPASAATSTSALLMSSMEQKIQLENEYYVAARATSAQAPSVIALKLRLNAVDAQIEQLKSRLTGSVPEARTISASIVTFEELELKRLFAEKLYTMAEDALERARMRAEQQNIYISTFVYPSVPQDAVYPDRWGFSLMTIATLIMIWAIMATLAAAIDDHRN